jgi:hypothetical protein
MVREGRLREAVERLHILTNPVGVDRDLREEALMTTTDTGTGADMEVDMNVMGGEGGEHEEVEHQAGHSCDMCMYA